MYNVRSREAGRNERDKLFQMDCDACKSFNGRSGEVRERTEIILNKLWFFMNLILFWHIIVEAGMI